MSWISRALQQYFRCHQVGRLGRMCSTRWENRNASKFKLKSFKGRDQTGAELYADNIKIYANEIERWALTGSIWLGLRTRDFMNTVMTLRVPLKMRKFLTSWATSNFSKWTLLLRVNYFFFHYFHLPYLLLFLCYYNVGMEVCMLLSSVK